jgi:hypothetical protein
LEHHSGRVCSYSGVRGSDGRSDVISVQVVFVIRNFNDELIDLCAIVVHGPK